MKLTIKHACGHEAPHLISGSEEDRRRREEWLRRQPCQACWRSQQSRAAETQLRGWDLPALEGTDDERSWAEVIRAKAMAHNREYRDRVCDARKFRPDEEDLKSAVRAAGEAALSELELQRSAAWWLDNRFEVLTYVKRRIMAEITPILDARRGGPA